MSDEHRLWFIYADENLAVARLALEGGYYNACLQNGQQAVEKYLKATLLARSEIFRKTHSIETLNRQLEEMGFGAGLSEEDCELLDSIYVPSKYPMGSVLPDFDPDEGIGTQCVEMAEHLRSAILSSI